MTDREPPGCPTPGACSCVEATTETEIERLKLRFDIQDRLIAEIEQLKLRVDSQDRLIAQQVRTATADAAEAEQRIKGLRLKLRLQEELSAELHKSRDWHIDNAAELLARAESAEKERDAFRQAVSAAESFRIEFKERTKASEARFVAATRNALEMAAQHLVEAAERRAATDVGRHVADVLREQAAQIRALADSEQETTDD